MPTKYDSWTLLYGDISYESFKQANKIDIKTNGNPVTCNVRHCFKPVLYTIAYRSVLSDKVNISRLCKTCGIKQAKAMAWLN